MIADRSNTVLVSAVSLWEIAIKIRVKKLNVGLPGIVRVFPAAGISVLPLEVAHLVAVVDLPVHHPDPFDHLLMAQAIYEDAAFVSTDRQAAAYPLTVLPCSA